MKTDPQRFVILLHTTSPRMQRPTHWDLMLETSDRLETWALEFAPDGRDVICCQSLPQHRKHYLNYEGPVSNDRGNVRRWDAGTFRWQTRSADEVIVELSGKRLRGIAELTRVVRQHDFEGGADQADDADVGADEWRFRFRPSP